MFGRLPLIVGLSKINPFYLVVVPITWVVGTPQGGLDKLFERILE
jgi:hypothetical protein